MTTEDKHAGFVGRAWLLMLEQGGRWTTTELAAKLNVDRDFADRMCWFMVRGGAVKKYRRTDRKNGVAFGVTNESVVPRETRLRDVLTATGIRVWE